MLRPLSHSACTLGMCVRPRSRLRRAYQFVQENLRWFVWSKVPARKLIHSKPYYSKINKYIHTHIPPISGVFTGERRMVLLLVEQEISSDHHCGGVKSTSVLHHVGRVSLDQIKYPWKSYGLSLIRFTEVLNVDTRTIHILNSVTELKTNRINLNRFIWHRKCFWVCILNIYF